MPVTRAAFRARDVRANIKELGFEKGIELSLTLLADEMVGVREGMKTHSELIDKCIDIVTDMTKIGGAMAEKINEMRRQEDQFDGVRGEGDDPPN